MILLNKSIITEFASSFVIPAKAGIQSFQLFKLFKLDSRLRGNDKRETIMTKEGLFGQALL